LLEKCVILSWVIYRAAYSFSVCMFESKGHTDYKTANIAILLKWIRKYC